MRTAGLLWDDDRVTTFIRTRSTELLMILVVHRFFRQSIIGPCRMSSKRTRTKPLPSSAPVPVDDKNPWRQIHATRSERRKVERERDEGSWGAREVEGR